jgi:hypothetical protein
MPRLRRESFKIQRGSVSSVQHAADRGHAKEMTNVEKVGYAILSASGKSLKIYADNRFIGLISLADVETCKKRPRSFAASIVKFNAAHAEKDSEKPKQADPKKLDFSLNLW